MFNESKLGNEQGIELNILFFSETFYPHGGGAELATYLYAKLLAERGLGVSVITNKSNGERHFSKDGSIKVYRRSLYSDFHSKYATLSRPDIFLSSLTRKLIKWADIIYVPRFWYSAILLAKACKKPVITHLHDYLPVCPLSNLFNKSEEKVCFHGNRVLCPPKCVYSYELSHTSGTANRKLVHRMSSTALNVVIGPNLGRLVALSDATICVSKAQKRLVVEMAPGLNRKIRVVYNPVPKLSYTEVDGEDFGYFGGPSFLKGFNILCAALAYTTNRIAKVHATNFRRAKSKWALSPYSGMRNQLALYRRLNETAFNQVWRKIRAVIVPSVWHEPLPYIVSEAMLRGRIVIASNVGGIPEQVQGSKGSFLIEVGSYKQLAEYIDVVAALTREEAIELGQHNKESFLKRFSNATAIRDFLRTCQQLT